MSQRIIVSNLQRVCFTSSESAIYPNTLIASSISTIPPYTFFHGLQMQRSCSLILRQSQKNVSDKLLSPVWQTRFPPVLNVESEFVLCVDWFVPIDRITFMSLRHLRLLRNIGEKETFFTLETFYDIKAQKTLLFTYIS